MNDVLGDRMKVYENVYRQKLNDELPIVVRLDGRAFHTITRGLKKPFDGDFILLMEECLLDLVKTFNFYYGYTQSDEISLLWYKQKELSQPIFGGNVNKINSILAAHCSVFFNHMKTKYFLNIRTGLFDCRAFNVENKIEATNYFIWRGKDCTRNSVSSLAQYHFSHKELHGKKTPEMLQMLENKNVFWNDLDCSKKFGVSFKNTPNTVGYDIKSIVRVKNVLEIESFKDRHSSIFP